jgi:hypothetical protein
LSSPQILCSLNLFLHWAFVKFLSPPLFFLLFFFWLLKFLFFLTFVCYLVFYFLVQVEVFLVVINLFHGFHLMVEWQVSWF